MRLDDLLGIIERAYKERIEPDSDYFTVESLNNTDLIIPLRWPEEKCCVSSVSEDDFNKQFRSYVKLRSGLIVSPIAAGILDEPGELYQPLPIMYRKLW
ncbi:MAG: hypothetical protein Q8R37_03050 [Nanoarchaeota archaeon]|nr:hypothetical protein [Nanoarchaeota archaeon]